MKPDSGGSDSTGSDPGAAEAAVGSHPARTVSFLWGFREPIVAILLAIAFFTAISGKPVDGVLLLIVAVSLAWDAGRHGGDTGRRTGSAGAGAPAPAPGRPPGSPAGAAGAPSTRRAAATASLLAGGALYAWVTGSFTRFSWPATAAIVGLGTIVVLVGWHGALRRRQARDQLPAAGVVLWGGLLVVGSVWELAALLQQPSITTASYAHPTLSALTDPVLAGGAGRSVFLAGWLAIGWYLVRR